MSKSELLIRRDLTTSVRQSVVELYPASHQPRSCDAIAKIMAIAPNTANAHSSRLAVIGSSVIMPGIVPPILRKRERRFSERVSGLGLVTLEGKAHVMDCVVSEAEPGFKVCETGNRLTLAATSSIPSF